MQQISFQNVLKTSASPLAILGARASTPDGSLWVYTKLNEAAAKGNVVVPVAVTEVETVSSSTNGAGQIVYITEGSAGWTAGAYENAWVLVDDGTGEGQVAKVKTNTADTLELYPQWALTTALSVSDSDIFISRYNTLSEMSAITDKHQNAIGITQVAFTTAAPYGWVLREGNGIVIAGEVLTVDLSFVAGDDTEGQVLKGTAAKGPFDEQALGTVLAANSTADKGALVMVDIGI